MSRDRGEAEGNGMDESGGATLVHEVLESFVEVARHAVRASETVDVLLLLSERAVAILPVQACGVLVRDAGGRLRAVGSSSASAELLDLFQIQEDEGPCVECLRTGSAVSVAAADVQARWPRFTALLATQGIAAVHAFPLRSGAATIGALNLFASGELTDDDRDVAQTFADLAALVLLRDDVAEDAASLARRLERVVQARATVAQAVGMLAERFTIDPDRALHRLRAAASAHDATVVQVATAVVERSSTHPASRDLASGSD